VRPVRAFVLVPLLLALLSPEAAVASAPAEEFAVALLEQGPPSLLESQLHEDPAKLAPALKALGDALMTEDPELRARLEAFLPGIAQAYAKRIGTTFNRDTHLGVLTALQFIDPMRYLQDPEFRERINPFLDRTLTPQTERAIREASLREMNEVLQVDFDTAERVAKAWKLATRETATMRAASSSGLKMPDDLAGPIEASIYSLNSSFFREEDARAFLAAVHAAAPNRQLVLLSDLPLSGKNVTVVETFSRPYTPWPRDPFVVARAGTSVMFVNRPNIQPDREDDANLVRGLLQNLPQSLVTAWQPRWTTAPTSFHNGHVLLTPDAVWISLHTVEIRALEILGLTRVPVQTFTTSAGVAAYQKAVKQAGDELGKLFQRPVRFVHPLEPKPDLMRSIAGGGGYDLDSLVTILPGARGATALVADLTLGATLASRADWRAAHRAYGFRGDPSLLGKTMTAAQATPRAKSLDLFLDTVASSLAKQGLRVQRVALLTVPASLITEGVAKDFLLTWNNVVLERRGAQYRAEGFASLLPEGDDAARSLFQKAGYELTLYPPLVRSVQLSGGYRCASNHVRPVQ
jgi:hypothetical protein